MTPLHAVVLGIVQGATEFLPISSSGHLILVPKLLGWPDQGLAFDAAVSSFSGRQQLYQRYYSGDPVRLAATLYDLYDKEAYVDRIAALLGDLETRRDDGGGATAFRPRPAAAE